MALLVIVPLECRDSHPDVSQRTACDPLLTLPPGFCARVYADSLGPIRHLGVSDNGDIYVARWTGPKTPGGLIALRDTNRDGRADERREINNSGGSGLALSKDAVYMATWTEVLRYRLRPGELSPSSNPDSIVVGLPNSGHAARSLVLDSEGQLLVNIGAPTNSCQVADKELGSPGRDPCPELGEFAGIWRFDSRRLRQRQSQGTKLVTGVRHMVAITTHPVTGALYGVQHGRDDLYEAFPNIYDRSSGERLPAEEMFLLEAGRDYGWPYCYFDGEKGRKVLAPEYGGDGVQVGRCAQATLPIFAFPAHWAPNGILFYSGAQFPAHYRGGAFVAFHGGWYRRPPNNGFNVSFLTFNGDAPAAQHEVFADGFAGRDKHPARARHRPVGLAEGPDGALYISDDTGGRIWRVTFTAPH